MIRAPAGNEDRLGSAPAGYALKTRSEPTAPYRPDSQGREARHLPVQQATKVETIINIKTAKALSVTVPHSLLGRAHEVIE